MQQLWLVMQAQRLNWCKTLSENIGKMALPNADEVIAKEVIRIANN
jgi:hypothetical protein